MTEAADRKQRTESARHQVQAAVMTAFEIEAGTKPPSPERETEILDWLNDLPDDLLEARPIGMIVKLICDHTKLPFDEALFADFPWAIEEQRTQPAFSPYAGFPSRFWDTSGPKPDPMSQPP